MMFTLVLLFFFSNLISANLSSVMESNEFSSNPLNRLKRHSDVPIGTTCPLDYPLQCRGVHGTHCYAFDSECDLKADCLDGVDEAGCWEAKLHYQDKIKNKLTAILQPLYAGVRVEPEHMRAVDALMNSNIEDKVINLYLTSLAKAAKKEGQIDTGRILNSLRTVYKNFEKYNVYQRHLMKIA